MSPKGDNNFYCNTLNQLVDSNTPSTHQNSSVGVCLLRNTPPASSSRNIDINQSISVVVYALGYFIDFQLISVSPMYTKYPFLLLLYVVFPLRSVHVTNYNYLESIDFTERRQFPTFGYLMSRDDTKMRVC